MGGDWRTAFLRVKCCGGSVTDPKAWFQTACDRAIDLASRPGITGSSMFNPTNHRNRKLYPNCSINIRSLRTVYRTCRSKALSNYHRNPAL